MSKISKTKRKKMGKIQDDIDNTIRNYNETQKQMEVAESPVELNNLLKRNQNRFKSVIEQKNEVKEYYKK